MKKSLLTLILLGASLQSQAAYQTVIEQQATEVQGASTCFYAVNKGTFSESQPEEVIIYLNSDTTSAANISIRLTPDMLPLQEGTIVSRQGLTVEYNNGILTQTKRNTSDGWAVNDYSIAKLKVSPDLQHIEAGYLKKVTKGIIREKVLAELSCRF
ncbi:MAG: hypothetical protein ACM3MG_13670 [Bacillota bacterium]